MHQGQIKFRICLLLSRPHSCILTGNIETKKGRTTIYLLFVWVWNLVSDINLQAPCVLYIGQAFRYFQRTLFIYLINKYI